MLEDGNVLPKSHKQMDSLVESQGLMSHKQRP